MMRYCLTANRVYIAYRKLWPDSSEHDLRKFRVAVTNKFLNLTPFHSEHDPCCVALDLRQKYLTTQLLRSNSALAVKTGYFSKDLIYCAFWEHI